MNSVIEQIDRSKQLFRADLQRLAAKGGMTEDVYVRYLSFQHHLTKGVQRHFLTVAAHPSLAGRRKLRDFLYKFALEEEPHFDIARHDLANMGYEPLPCPLDVQLWWAFFDKIVVTRPFVRLENLGAGVGTLGHDLLDQAPFLNPSNTRFLEIHFHEELPHGDQIIAALESVELSADEQNDLVEGAKIGATLYLRMARWALGFPELTHQFAIHAGHKSPAPRGAIATSAQA
jgi:hypothetical protein